MSEQLFPGLAESYLEDQLDLFGDARRLIKNIFEYIEPMSHEDRESILFDLLKGTGVTRDEVESLSKRRMPKRLVYPVNVSIRRYYRAYVSVAEGSSNEQILKRCRELVRSEQDEALTLDPDLDIEDDDITEMYIDEDGVQEDYD